MVTDTDANNNLPTIIQGGMGIGVSTWKLAQAVAQEGQLGVVSGTAIERLIACRLQEGDQDKTLRRAFRQFPNQDLAQRVYTRWYQPWGLSEPGAYQKLPLFGTKPTTELLELTVIAAFAEVWLAKQGHGGLIGINLLEKIQAPTLPVLYGALLAGVDYIFMGAGIPKHIPALLDELCQHRACALRLHLAEGDTEELPFDPSMFGCAHLALPRPKFIAIVSSHILASSLARVDGIDGFIVETPDAGGHNAPPRGWSAQDSSALVYGEKDLINLERIAKLGLPFWLAGQCHHKNDLLMAQKQGAVGIQVGTPFALCAESGMQYDLRRHTIIALLLDKAVTKTEGRGSPTGFPFKVLEAENNEGGRSPSKRKRQTCDHGYLRTAYRKSDGSVGWRCAAEPRAQYKKKGGESQDCTGRRCLCRGLVATAGHPHQMKDGSLEWPLVTFGSLSVDNLQSYLQGSDDYTAADVLKTYNLSA